MRRNLAHGCLGRSLSWLSSLRRVDHDIGDVGALVARAIPDPAAAVIGSPVSNDRSAAGLRVVYAVDSRRRSPGNDCSGCPAAIMIAVAVITIMAMMVTTAMMRMPRSRLDVVTAVTVRPAARVGKIGGDDSQRAGGDCGSQEQDYELADSGVHRFPPQLPALTTSKSICVAPSPGTKV